MFFLYKITFKVAGCKSQSIQLFWANVYAWLFSLRFAAVTGLQVFSRPLVFSHKVMERLNIELKSCYVMGISV